MVKVISKVVILVLQILKCLTSRPLCRGSGRKSNILSHRWRGPPWWLISDPQPATQTTVNILGTLPLPTRLDRSQELNSVFGFETALNARVLGIREDVKLSWTKKSLKYSYLLTQEHET